MHMLKQWRGEKRRERHMNTAQIKQYRPLSKRVQNGLVRARYRGRERNKNILKIVPSSGLYSACSEQNPSVRLSLSYYSGMDFQWGGRGHCQELDHFGLQRSVLCCILCAMQPSTHQSELFHYVLHPSLIHSLPETERERLILQ